MFQVFFLSELKPKDDAEKFCKENNGSLITIGTNDEQAFLYDYLYTKSNIVDTIWLGAKRNSSGDKFKWTDGSDMFFSNWFEPLKHLDEKDDYNCIEMMPEQGAKGKWTNEPCNKRNLIVCQKPQSYSCETREKKLFNIRKLFDYMTIFSSNFSHFKIIPDQGKRLQIFIFPSQQASSSWDNAKKLCEDAYFASLVEIESLTKQSNVLSFLKQINEPSSFWLGGSKGSDGKFRWLKNLTEIPDSSPNWETSQSSGNGTRIWIYNTKDVRQGKWVSGADTENRGVMCEASFSY